ncbi:Fanconi anemia group E protein-like [Ylistrum balloti]|uniref:Fanconi anemia group E protein-like n=1 Tax=Ylistrum balloti TaxID=509963 RepID=UPI00290596A2|nr:Fanconi anemia group E protein-like [Ylistrum balloti]
MSLTTPQLIQKLPPSWWGLFGAMRLDYHHGDATEIWYQTEAKSEYGCRPDWDEVLASLVVKEPVCDGANLIFKSRFVQLPSDIQRHFLRFLLRHRDEIPADGLSEFVEDAQSYFGASESWQGVLLKTLATYNKVKKQESSNQLCEIHYTFTSGNQNLASLLCERLRKSSESCSWKKIPLTELAERRHQKMETYDDNLQVDTAHFPREEANPASMYQHGTPCINDALSADVITIVSDGEEDTSEELMDVTGATLIRDGIVKEELALNNDVDPVLLGKGEKLRESWQSGSETPPEIDLFLVATADQIKAVSLELKFDSLTDNEVLAACQSLTTLASVLSEAASIQFMTSVVYPKIAELNHSASRQLLGVISLAAEHFPKGLVEGIFVKCLEQGLGSAQTDIFCKVIKTGLQAAAQIQMIQKMAECTKCLDDNIVCIYQTLIDTKMELSENILTDVLNTLHCSSSGLEKNLKYGKLLLAIINKHGQKFTSGNLNVMEEEVQKNGTFLRKALSAALNKLKK